MLAVETLSSSVGSCKRSPQGTNNCISPKNVPMSITKPGSHLHTHTHMQTCSSKKTNKQWFRVCATLTDGSQNTVLQQPITMIEIPGSWEMIGQGPVWLRPTQNAVFRVFIRDFVQSLNRHQSLEVHLIGNIKLYFPTRQSWTWAQNDIERQWGRSVYKALVIIVVVVVVIVVGVSGNSGSG